MRRTLSRLSPFLILLLAFAVRMYATDTAYVTGDQTYLRGQGIAVLESVLQGRWSALPIFTYNSSSGLPNPAMMAYAWALIAFIDRSQLVATMMSLMLSTLGVAMVFSLAKAIMSRPAALFAMLLMAINPWAVNIARGTWQPGQLEFCFVLVAWLLITGLARGRPRWVVLGFVAAAIAMWTYTLAFALVAQAGLASLIGYRRTLRRAIQTGWIIVGASVVLLLALTIATGKVTTFTDFVNKLDAPLATVEPAAQTITTPQDNSDHPALQAIRIATGFDYVQTWVDPNLPLWAIGNAANQLWGMVLLGLAGLGIAFSIWAWVRRTWRAQLWTLLWVWLLLPIIAFSFLEGSITNFLVQPYYLVLTVPAGYLIPALAVDELRQRLSKRVIPALTYAAIAIIAPFAIWNFAAAATTAYAQPFVGTLGFIPLKWSERIGALWRSAGCDIVLDPRFENDTYWVASLWQRAQPIPLHTSAIATDSDVWMVAPGKLNCLMREKSRIPLGAQETPHTFPDGSAVYFYTASEATPSRLDEELTVNIGWSLLNLTTPESVRLGEAITVTQVWRVNELPNEEFWHWYYAPNVKLVAGDGRVLAEHWGKSVNGWVWQVGDEIRSTITFQPPPGTAPGDYMFQVSLFDPNQKRNAVYFSPAVPNEPILIIERPIRIE